MIFLLLPLHHLFAGKAIKNMFVKDIFIKEDIEFERIYYVKVTGVFHFSYAHDVCAFARARK